MAPRLAEIRKTRNVFSGYPNELCRLPKIRPLVLICLQHHGVQKLLFDFGRLPNVRNNKLPLPLPTPSHPRQTSKTWYDRIRAIISEDEQVTALQTNVYLHCRRSAASSNPHIVASEKASLIIAPAHYQASTYATMLLNLISKVALCFVFSTSSPTVAPLPTATT